MFAPCYHSPNLKEWIVLRSRGALSSSRFLLALRVSFLAKQAIPSLGSSAQPFGFFDRSDNLETNLVLSSPASFEVKSDRTYRSGPPTVCVSLTSYLPRNGATFCGLPSANAPISQIPSRGNICTSTSSTDIEIMLEVPKQRKPLASPD